MKDASKQIRRICSTTLICILIGAVPFLYAKAEPIPSDRGCFCGELVNNLISKVEADYVGYQIEVSGKRDAEYRRHIAALRLRARRTLPDDCISVLQDFVKFFRDGHLFVGNNPRLSKDEVDRLTNAAERLERDEQNIRGYLDRNAKRLDPIEGIWYSKDGYRVGIIRDKRVGRRDFVGLMLSGNVEGWKSGQAKASFRKLRDGSYDVVFYAKNHSPRYPNVYMRGQTGGAAIRRGLLLHMPPTTWGREYPLKPNEQGLIDPVDPRQPTIRAIDKSTVVVSVPSHSPEYRQVLDKLVETYRERISQAMNLIIDIRGDEGGSAGMTSVLMPFIVTPNKKAVRFASLGNAAVVSSPDNISYYQEMQSQGWVPAKLVERMRANPGKVVSFDDPGTPASTSPESSTDLATPLPRNVAILMDRSVVSAGEAFVLRVMKNEKVKLFGENTAGVIDYETVNIVNLESCSSLGVYLGYPTVAASDRLPAGGINRTGIPPDVRIGRAVKDPDLLPKNRTS